MRHVWSVLCSRATTDRDTNNVSLIEVLEQVEFVVREPLNYPANTPFNAQLVTLWARSPLDVPTRTMARLRLLSPTGTELAAVESEVDLETSTRNRQLLNVRGLRIGGDGWH